MCSSVQDRIISKSKGEVLFQNTDIQKIINENAPTAQYLEAKRKEYMYFTEKIL